MDYVLDPARELGLHIFAGCSAATAATGSRAPYRRHVVGSLPYERMLAAYKAYKVFLNVNSVTDSADDVRAPALRAVGRATAVVSAPAATIEPIFGDTVTVVDERRGDRAAALDLLLTDDDVPRPARAPGAPPGLRRAPLQPPGRHGAAAVGLAGARGPRPDLSVMVPTMPPRAARPRAAHGRPPVHRAICSSSSSRTASYRRATRAGARTPGSTYRGPSAAADRHPRRLHEPGRRRGRPAGTVAKMDDDNFYGDALPAPTWCAPSTTPDADVVGKWAHYVHLEGTNATLLRFADAEHRYVDAGPGRHPADAPRHLPCRIRFEDLPRRVDTTFLAKVRAAGVKVYAADRFNFVSVRTRRHRQPHLADHRRGDQGALVPGARRARPLRTGGGVR